MIHGSAPLSKVKIACLKRKARLHISKRVGRLHVKKSRFSIVVGRHWVVANYTYIIYYHIIDSYLACEHNVTQN